ncbi:hypothetical protein W03_21070 [Nitrosomonas sp. PY1]|nr:hypothetical protein W03_21070 [Nitrosomonas sp. PY1]
MRPLIAATEGYGHAGRIHSSHFFELAGQLLEVTMAVTVDEADCLFARLRDENVQVFYVKTPIEFGMTGGS